MTPAPTIATSAFGVLATRLLDVSTNPHCRARPRQVVKGHSRTLAQPAVIYPGRWLIRTPPSREAGPERRAQRTPIRG